MESENISGYRYVDANYNASHSWLLPALTKILRSININTREDAIFELGCGNGAIAYALNSQGYNIIGVDPSEEGIRLANQEYPHIKLRVGSAYDNLASEYGKFRIVLSLEVVEHVYFPRKYAATLFDLLEEDGIAIVSTPYHGYVKNLALALSGKMDQHFTALWDHGHIKFWSALTLRRLLTEVGFEDITFLRIGRIPPLAKSMIAIARK